MDLMDYFKEALESSSLLAYFLAFLGGMGDCLTPCSAVATPVTIAYFSKAMKRDLTTGQMLRQGFVFLAGLLISYSIFGAVAALVGGVVFQWIGTSPWPYLIIGLFLSYLLLVSMELMPMKLTPSFLRQTKVPGIGGQVGSGAYLGALFAGVAVATMMGPCAAPILTAILYIVAQKQDVFFGVSLLISFAMGIGVFMLTVGFSGSKGLVMLGRLGRLRGKMQWVMNGVILLLVIYLFSTAWDKMRSFDVAPEDLPDYLWEFSSFPQDSAALETGALKLGILLPDFSFTKPDGSVGKLSDFRGSNVFITFWGIWCAACVEEIPDVVEMKKFAGKNGGLEVISLDALDEKGRLLPFMKEKGINYPVIHDSENMVHTHYGLMSHPYNILLDRQGRIIYMDGAFPQKYKDLLDE